MKLGKKIAWALLIVIVAMQFYRPEKNQDPGDHLSKFLEETNPPQEVSGILKSSCYDCHTNQTNYPWYNQVAPVSWWLADHIEEGKEHLNFSEKEGPQAGRSDRDGGVSRDATERIHLDTFRSQTYRAAAKSYHGLGPTYPILLSIRRFTKIGSPTAARSGRISRWSRSPAFRLGFGSTRYRGTPFFL